MLISRKVDFDKKLFTAHELANQLSGASIHERVSMIAGLFDDLVQVSSFSLADQVLTQALVANDVDADFVDVAGERVKNQGSIRAITSERYALKFQQSGKTDHHFLLQSQSRKLFAPKFVSIDHGQGVVRIDLLADWSTEELVAYVLDHEVPVNPEDMPGFTARVAA